MKLKNIFCRWFGYNFQVNVSWNVHFLGQDIAKSREKNKKIQCKKRWNEEPLPCSLEGSVGCDRIIG